MFNYYQHRASPDHEASDVGYEEFVHLIFFLGWGLSLAPVAIDTSSSITGRVVSVVNDSVDYCHIVL